MNYYNFYPNLSQGNWTDIMIVFTVLGIQTLHLILNFLRNILKVHEKIKSVENLWAILSLWIISVSHISQKPVHSYMQK